LETYTYEKVKCVSSAAASLYEFFNIVIARKNIVIKTPAQEEQMISP
jgi:hypothetical protein